MQATVTEIGKHAIDDSEKMIILFGETATDTLKQHAVIQSFPEKDQVTLAEGDHLKTIQSQKWVLLPIVTCKVSLTAL